MNRAITRIVVLLITLGTPFFISEVRACVCDPHQTPYRDFQEARAVFVGKVTGSKDIEVIEKAGDKTYTNVQRVFQFSLNESLKGLKTSQIDINVGSINSDCYQGFTVGETYLVYAFGDSDSSLESGTCTRTSMLSEAAANLHYIRDLLKGVPEPR